MVPDGYDLPRVEAELLALRAKKLQLQAQLDELSTQGVTMFVPSDPNPSLDKIVNPLVGLRFEVFQDQMFKFPHYVILKDVPAATANEEKCERNYIVYKHTLPAFVPLNALALKYLNTDLEKFISLIHKNITCLSHRQSAVKKISDFDPSIRVQSDAAAKLIHITSGNFYLLWEDGIEPERCVLFEDDVRNIAKERTLNSGSGNFLDRLKKVLTQQQASSP